MYFCKQAKYIFGLTLALFVTACSDSQPIAEVKQAKVAYQYSAPEYLDDGWQVGHLSDFGFDRPKITNLIQQIEQGDFGFIDSISIVRNNTLLLQQNFRSHLSEYDEWIDNKNLQKHLVHSTSKSFVSALTGIAIQQGYIRDINVPFYEFFDYPEIDNWSQQKENLSLKNVLTMQLGFDWNEWDHPPSSQLNSLTQLVNNHQDWVKALLDLPVSSSPGSQYTYNTIASIALGQAIEESTNQPLAQFAQQYLFEPLQIKSQEWLTTPTGEINTGSGLFLESRDMAKLGQLYLNDGNWNGIQILDSRWVKASLAQHVTLDSNYTKGYGFQWWLGEFNYNQNKIGFYSSRGYGGQFIIVVPDYDLVLTFTGQNYENGLYDIPFQIVEEFIFAAIDN